MYVLRNDSSHFPDPATLYFEDQFEHDGADYLFRADLKGAPVRVSEEERIGFVYDYERDMDRLMVSHFAVLILWIVGATALVIFTPNDVAQWLLSSTGSLAVVSFLALPSYIYRAPARGRQGGPPGGAPWWRREVRRRRLARVGWNELAWAVFLAIMLLLITHGTKHGWGLFWPILGAFVLVTAAVQALRKWQIERADSDLDRQQDV
jgi:Na+/proline symporter